jgi:hypothetical protein
LDLLAFTLLMIMSQHQLCAAELSGYVASLEGGSSSSAQIGVEWDSAMRPSYRHFTVLFIGADRGRFSSYFTRGLELADALRLFTGTHAAACTDAEFLDKGFPAKAGHLDFVILVKKASSRVLSKARQLRPKHLIFDTVDHFKRVPRHMSAVYVNNVAQKHHYSRLLQGDATPVFVLPHHQANPAGIWDRKDGSVLKPMNRRRSVAVSGVAPKNVKELKDWGKRNNYSIVFLGDAVKAAGPFLTSLSYTVLDAQQDVVIAWAYPDRVDQCWKPSQRFTLALSTGVPTVASSKMESFLEAAPDYPLFASSEAEMVKVLDKLFADPGLAQRAREYGLAAAARFNMQRVAWVLHSILLSVSLRASNGSLPSIQISRFYDDGVIRRAECANLQSMWVVVGDYA